MRQGVEWGLVEFLIRGSCYYIKNNETKKKKCICLSTDLFVLTFFLQIFLLEFQLSPYLFLVGTLISKYDIDIRIWDFNFQFSIWIGLLMLFPRTTHRIFSDAYFLDQKLESESWDVEPLSLSKLTVTIFEIIHSSLYDWDKISFLIIKSSFRGEPACHQRQTK